MWREEPGNKAIYLGTHLCIIMSNNYVVVFFSLQRPAEQPLQWQFSHFSESLSQPHHSVSGYLHHSVSSYLLHSVSGYLHHSVSGYLHRSVSGYLHHSVSSYLLVSTVINMYEYRVRD